MAGYQCQASEPGEEHSAQFLLTNLEDGDTVTLCGPHLPGWCIALLEAAGYTVLAPGAEAPAAAPEEAGAATAPPGPKRRRRGQENGEAALSSEASPFPDAAPIDG